MLGRAGTFYVYRIHPILDALAQCLRAVGDERLVTLFETHVAFLYPKTLAISFVGAPLPDGLTDPDLPDIRAADPSFAEENVLESTASKDIRDARPVENAIFLRFLEQLVQCLDQVDLVPIFVVDLRDQRILDEPFLVKSLEVLSRKVQHILLLCSSDIRDELLRDMPSKSFLDTSELKAYLRQLWRSGEKSLDLALPPFINLASLDEHLGRVDLAIGSQSAYCTVLDFSKANNSSFFSIVQLVVIMHAASRRTGNVWRISSANQTVTRKLILHRVFEALGPILDKGCIPASLDASQPTLDELQTSCGIHVFDRSSLSTVIETTDNYMAKLRRAYAHLNHPVLMISDSVFTSRKPRPYRQTLYQIIRLIISELIENVVLHSDGLGFFAARANETLLFLYIGDCGVGVKRGILRNYDLTDMIVDERQALEYLFQLASFRTKRRGDDAYNEGAGFGLRDTLQRIFACKGKFICRSGRHIASFMNPVSKVSSPSLQQCLGHVDGTQFMIMIPLSFDAVLPKGANEFLALQI